MTIRAILDMKKRRIMTVAYAGFSMFAVGTILSAFYEFFLVVALPGFSVAVLAVVYAWFTFRCPRCTGAWYFLMSQTGKAVFSVDKRIRFCPYCGCNIDTESVGGQETA